MFRTEIVAAADLRSEDGGNTLVATLRPNPPRADGLFVRVQSRDETGQHAALNQLAGRLVRVTVEDLGPVCPTCGGAMVGVLTGPGVPGGRDPEFPCFDCKGSGLAERPAAVADQIVAGLVEYADALTAQPPTVAEDLIAGFTEYAAGIHPTRTRARVPVRIVHPPGEEIEAVRARCRAVVDLVRAVTGIGDPLVTTGTVIGELFERPGGFDAAAWAAFTARLPIVAAPGEFLVDVADRLTDAGGWVR